MENKLKYSVILNTKTTDSKKLSLTYEIIDMIKKDHEVELFETQSEDKARLVFQDLSKKKFDRLVIVGGDGSVSFAINQMIINNLEEKLLAYIPAGTANILQIETGMIKKSHEIYKILISNKHRKVSLGKINDRYFF